MTIRRHFGGGIAITCMLAACSPGSASEASRLAAALESVPGVAPRLSVPTSFRRCVEQAPPEGTIIRAECPPRRSSPKPLAALARALPAGDDPSALHARAIVDMVVQDERGIALDRSISSLRRLEAMVDRPAPVLADLSAALIVRAERTQAPRDLLEAYEIAEQALKHEPRNTAALYNRALALDRFGLVDETARDWQAYLAADSASGWADEARRRRRALLAIQPPPRPPPDAPLAEYARYAVADPQGARELGMDDLLGEWGAAVEAGDGPRAADRLARAVALAEGLARRPGGDASLADMVSTIRAVAPEAAATRELAWAHRQYGAGRPRYDSLDVRQAEARFSAAVGAAKRSPVLRAWAALYFGASSLQRGDIVAGERILVELAASTETSRHPALVARALWPVARTLARHEEWERALNVANEAARQFARAAESEYEGAALGIVAEARFVLGEPDSGYAAVHRAVTGLQPYRASSRLHNVFVTAATAAADDGLLSSAIRLQGEGVSVATRTRNATFETEARLEHARYLAAAGRLTRAVPELAVARAVMRHVHPDAVGWFQAHLSEAEAVLSLRSSPQHTRRALDSAASFFATVPLPFRVLPALVGAAEASLAVGDAAGAVRRLEEAIRLLDRRRHSIRIEPRRAAVFDAARSAVDRLVLLKLAQDRPAEALAYMDRARASLAPAAGASGPEHPALRAPEGEVAVEYARIADTLFVWTLSGSSVDITRIGMDTLRFTRTLEDLEARLQRGAPVEEVRPGLAVLYDMLIRPVEAHLGRRETPLVIIADGEIAGVPFAALFDDRRGRYVMEQHALRFAVSLREALRQPKRRSEGRALFVADPAFDRSRYPLLEPLRYARQEVGAIADAYPHRTVLAGHAATREAVQSALAQARTVHFAGHAVFDDQRPERSYLVLASQPDRPGAARLTATELARLDLRHVRLFVISACRTVRSGRNRAGGFTGLSGALLAAGAGGTVGSMWQVDDRLTATLMTHFHRAYQVHGDGPRALRDAQTALLRSPDAALRNPAAWAGFRYAGR